MISSSCHRYYFERICHAIMTSGGVIEMAYRPWICDQHGPWHKLLQATINSTHPHSTYVMSRTSFAGNPIDLPFIDIDDVEESVVGRVFASCRSTSNLLEDRVSSTAPSTLFLLYVQKPTFYFPQFFVSLFRFGIDLTYRIAIDDCTDVIGSWVSIYAGQKDSRRGGSGS